jgi:hypothetical protein
MNPRDEADHQRLIRLARTQACPDPDVAECWGLLIQGMEGGFFGAAQLEKIATALEAGGGMGADEISFDAEGDQVVVTFIRDECRSPRDMFVATLRDLHRRYLLGPAYERGEQAGRASVTGTSTGTPDEAAVQEVFRLLFSLLAGADPKAAPQDVSSPSPELQTRVEQVRELARRLRVAPHTVDPSAAAGAEPSLSPQLQALIGPLYERLSEVYRDEQTRDPEALRQWLRVLSHWLKGDSAAGAELDQLLDKLEAKVGPLLQPPGATATQRSEALHTRVRNSIRDALKKRGFPTDK